MADINGIHFYFKVAVNSDSGPPEDGFNDSEITFLINQLRIAILSDGASKDFFRSLKDRTIYLSRGGAPFGAAHTYMTFKNTDRFKSEPGDSDPKTLTKQVEIIQVGSNLVGPAGAGYVYTPENVSFHEEVSRELFHELAHAATAPSPYNGLYWSSLKVQTQENIAIAAENLIYAPAHGSPVRVGHDDPKGASIDPTIAFRGLGPVSYKLIQFDHRVSGKFTVQSGSATLSKWYVGKNYVAGVYTQGKPTGQRMLDNETVLGFVDGQRPVISASGTPSTMLTRVLAGSLSAGKATISALTQVAKTESFLTDLSDAIAAVSVNSSFGMRLSEALAAPDLTSVIRALGISNELSVANKPLTGPLDDTTGDPAVSLYLHGAADGTLLVGGSGDVDTAHQINFAHVTDTLVAGPGKDTNILVAGTGRSSSPDIRNELIGGAGADYLIGQSGNDALTGGAGDDVLIKSSGKDWLDGGRGINTVVLPQNSKLNEVVDMRSMASKGYGTITDSTGISQVKNVQIIVGGAGRTTFYGNGHNVFIAGSGGAEFHLKSGDVAIANPASKVGNVYYVTSTDISKNHVGIVGLGKDDKIFVDGKLFNGSTALATTLGMSYDSNADGSGNAGVFTHASSSWGTSITQPRLYDTYDQPADQGLRYHYWINGTDPSSPTELNLKDVTYVKSDTRSGVAAGNIYFTSQTGDGFGSTTFNASLDISVIGWQQGYAGISFLENNLARDTLGALSIGYGISGWAGQVLGGGGGYADAAANPGFYMLGGALTAVGGLFDPNSSEWQETDLGELSAWNKLEQLISAIEDDTADGTDLPDQNPFGSSDDGDGGGGIGTNSNQPGDEVGLGPSVAVLQGDAFANVLDPAGGYGEVVGGGGGDTIIYGLGYGPLIIDEQDVAATPANVLQFGADILPGDVMIDANSEGDIVLTIGDDASITIKGALKSTSDLKIGVQQITFSDGTTWSYADMLGVLGIATSDRTAIYGDSAANILDVAALASSAVGGGGGDTFIFESGYGDVTIEEKDVSGNASNILTFGAGLDPWSASVTADSDGSIAIDFGNGDRVTIANALLSDVDTTYGVQQLSFSDGTIWSYADLLAQADTPSSSNRALYGDRSANYLWGGGIATSLTGGGGGDTFEFDRGDVPITIYESDSAAASANQLSIYGFDPSEISVSANAAGDLLLHADGIAQVTIAGALNSDSQIARGVQSVTFGDGTTWTYSDLVARANIGSSENLELFGDGNSNFFDSQGLATSIVGGGGGDVILYQRGYGALSIVEADSSSSPSNVLEFGPDIVAADVTVVGDATGNLVISAGNGDMVTLVGALRSGADVTNGVQAILFADGTSWTYADLLQKALSPSVGGTIVGDKSANTIDSGGMAAVAIGNGGSDTFLYEVGYGALTIDEKDDATTAGNVLALGAGISAANVTAYANAGGDILLSFGGSDAITLANALNSDGITAFGVQAIEFDDGTSWSYADLLARLSTPTSGSAIFGDRSANVLDTAGLASKIIGGGGGDTIVFNQGYGQVRIRENDTSSQPHNVLRLGVGIDPSQIVVSGTATGDIVLVVGNGDSIILINALRSSDDITFGIQEVVFQDGSVWTYNDLLVKLQTSSATNTTLYGDTGANVLDGAGIATSLVGNGGDDTFIYEQGYGALTIDELDAGGLPNNRLVLGVGISTTDVSVSANATGDLILAMASGDAITLKNALASGPDLAFGVQEVAFADGTIWSYTDLVELAATASPLNNQLYGDVYANYFDSAGLAHRIVGGGGGDEFFYARGYGALSINERDGGDAPSNSLTFGPGIRPTDVTVSVTASGNIVLSLSDGDSVTLEGANTTTTGLSIGVQEVKFDGGLTWDAAQIQALALGSWMIADDGRSTQINEATNFGTSAPTIHLAFASTDTTVALGEDRQSLTLTSVNDTVVTILDLLRTGARTGQVIEFSNGVAWSLGDAISQASNLSEVINYEVGSPAADDLNFGGGIKEIIGFGGGDRIRYNTGDGHVTLNEVDSSATPDNVLIFGPGIALSDLIITSDGSNLYLRMQDNDQVVIRNALTDGVTESYGVQRVMFADGSSATYAQLLAIADTGSVENSGTLFGDANANLIDPAGYSHVVNGQGGNDTIVYNRGYGNLKIADAAASAGGGATILFGPDISITDIAVQPEEYDAFSFNPTSAIRIIVVGEGTIRVENELSGAPAVIELRFADGTTLHYADLLQMIETPIAGAEAIGGDYGPNFLDTGGLVHKVIGNGGGDTIRYDRGYGALNIQENDTSDTPDNRLLFAADINPSDVDVLLSYQGTFSLNLGGGDIVYFRAPQLYPGSGIETVQFADGTVWTSAQLLQKADTGAPGRISIQGTTLDETFDGRGFTNYIAGAGGSDIYVFNRGYGPETINDSRYYSSDSNTIAFGADIAPDDVVVTEVDGDLILSLGANDRLVVLDQFSSPQNYYGVQNVTFVDGTTWDASDLAARVAVPPSGAAPQTDLVSVTNETDLRTMIWLREPAGWDPVVAGRDRWMPVTGGRLFEVEGAIHAELDPLMPIVTISPSAGEGGQTSRINAAASMLVQSIASFGVANAADLTQERADGIGKGELWLAHHRLGTGPIQPFNVAA